MAPRKPPPPADEIGQRRREALIRLLDGGVDLEAFEGEDIRFRALPPHMREWLISKSKADLEALDSMQRDYGAAQTIGKFGKWLMLTIAAFFAGSFALAKAGVEIFAWIKGGGR